MSFYLFSSIKLIEATQQLSRGSRLVNIEMYSQLSV